MTPQRGVAAYTRSTQTGRGCVTVACVTGCVRFGYKGAITDVIARDTYFRVFDHERTQAYHRTYPVLIFGSNQSANLSLAAWSDTRPPARARGLRPLRDFRLLRDPRLLRQLNLLRRRRRRRNLLVAAPRRHHHRRLRHQMWRRAACGQSARKLNGRPCFRAKSFNSSSPSTRQCTKRRAS